MVREVRTIPVVICFLMAPGLQWFALAQSSLNVSIQVQNPTINCGQCTELYASYGELRRTSSYQVMSIPFTPPVSPSVGTLLPLISTWDDTWDAPVPITFPFCFLDTVRNLAQMCSNGVVRFDPNVVPAGSYCNWSFSAPIPSGIDPPWPSMIHGAYHDMDPSVYGTIRYTVIGTPPFRQFVISYDNVAHYWCNYLSTTQQIVLHETYNYVDVYIYSKPICLSWNGGLAVIGIEANATTGWTPPGRNTGIWWGASEAWRFVPNGPPLPRVIEWYLNNTLVATGTDTLLACPLGYSEYVLRVGYVRCSGDTLWYSDTVVFNFPTPPSLNLPPDTTICAGDTLVLQVNSSATWDSVIWSPDSVVFCGGQPCLQAQIFPTQQETLLVVGYGYECPSLDTVIVRIQDPQITMPDTFVCLSDSLYLEAQIPQGMQWQWLPDSVVACATCPGTWIYPSASQNIVVLAWDSLGCLALDTFQVHVQPLPAPELGPNPLICLGDSIQLATGIGGSGYSYSWTPPIGLSCTDCATPWASPPGNTTYIVTVTDSLGCHGTDTITVLVEMPPVASVNPDSLAYCYGESDTLSINSGNFAIQWLTMQDVIALGNNTYAITSPVSTTYTIVVLADSVCPNDTILLPVIVYPLPEATIMGDTTVVEGQLLTVEASTDGLIYWWSTGDTQTLQTVLWAPMLPPDVSRQDTVIRFYVINEYGCFTEAWLRVWILDVPCTEEYIFVPNVFTPNGDGINDQFYVYSYAANLIVKEWRIYDRWGRLLFQQKDVPFDPGKGRTVIGWDGTLPGGQPARPDVYVYYLEVACPGRRGARYFLKGDVTLLR